MIFLLPRKQHHPCFHERLRRRLQSNQCGPRLMGFCSSVEIYPQCCLRPLSRYAKQSCLFCYVHSKTNTPGVYCWFYAIATTLLWIHLKKIPYSALAVRPHQDDNSSTGDRRVLKVLSKTKTNSGLMLWCLWGKLSFLRTLTSAIEKSDDVVHSVGTKYYEMGRLFCIRVKNV